MTTAVHQTPATNSRISVVIPTFRDAAHAIALVRSLGQQQLPMGFDMEIIVVDDGSQDGSAERIETVVGDRIRLLALAVNSGRTAARNAGAAVASGSVIMFMDCDCLPVGTELLKVHLENLGHREIASCGQVTGYGGGFWDRYQSDASMRRQYQHARQITYSGSSQNFAVIGTAFDQIGGFDARYRHYGFEDRDLFLRLSRLGTIAWDRRAAVQHLDRLTLGGVLGKMQEAAEFSAELFAKEHPDAYRKLGYAAIDARLHGWLRPIGRTLGPLVLRGSRTIEPLLHNRWVPYPLAKFTLKVLTALVFLYGTTKSGR